MAPSSMSRSAEGKSQQDRFLLFGGNSLSSGPSSHINGGQSAPLALGREYNTDPGISSAAHDLQNMSGVRRARGCWHQDPGHLESEEAKTHQFSLPLEVRKAPVGGLKCDLGLLAGKDKQTPKESVARVPGPMRAQRAGGSRGWMLHGSSSPAWGRAFRNKQKALDLCGDWASVGASPQL